MSKHGRRKPAERTRKPPGGQGEPGPSRHEELPPPAEPPQGTPAPGRFSVGSSLAERRGGSAAEVIPLGYVDGLLWRLVLLAPPPGSAGDPVPQLQHQHPGSPEWELVSHDDLLAHLAWQAYRRGLRGQPDRTSHSGLVLPPTALP